MSLTVETLHRLRSKGFDTLYSKHEAKWKALVENATTYAKTYIGGTDKVRPADVAEVLQNALKIDPDFEGHVKGKSLKEKYWVAHFADYIMDQIYPPAEIK
jgi:hypothetical protein